MTRIVVPLLAALIAASGALAQNPRAPAGDAEHGKALFMRDGCYQCHGMAAQGAGVTGPRIARTGLPYEGFIHQLREPLMDMPPYQSAIVSDAEAADIYAFLKGLPAPAAAKDLPLLMNMGVR